MNERKLLQTILKITLFGIISIQAINIFAEDAYKSYLEESKTTQEVNKKKYDWFLQKTDEVFNNEFKGFEFNVGEKSFTYKPGDAGELKSAQADVNNFVKKFVDEKGLMKDAKGYHRSLAIAMNPEKFAQFF